MKRFEDEMSWTERQEKSSKSILEFIKERIVSVLSNSKQQKLVEDRYELETCRTLSYESVTGWILRNKTDNSDGALLVRLRNDREKDFPIVVSVMFLQNNQVLLGKEYLKKIYHCAFLEEELNKMFDGKESLIIR